MHFDFWNPVNLVITPERKFILVPTINMYDIREVTTSVNYQQMLYTITFRYYQKFNNNKESANKE